MVEGKRRTGTPVAARIPHGAWEFHERLILATPRKPLRLWLEVGDRNNLNPHAMRDGMHDAGHADRAVKQQTLAEALVYVWGGYGKGP